MLSRPLHFALPALVTAAAVLLSSPLRAGAQEPGSQAPPPAVTRAAPAGTQASDAESKEAAKEKTRQKAEEQMRAQEKQRFLGVVPNFNTSYISDAAPLSSRQKFRLAFRSVSDPVTFVAAAGDAGISQATDDFKDYGQGASGYAKRFGASYADTFDGGIFGNAVFPSLLRQDPRYFRLGRGSFTHRLLYSLSTTVWCKNDNGKWGPNYSNILGNFAAGGISNLYYPKDDRGAGLTTERALVVTAEGTLGGLADEFWPDVANKIFKNHFKNLRPSLPPPTSSIQPH